MEILAHDALALGNHIEIAYMELCQPDLDSIILKNDPSTIESIRLLPLFLASGKHLQKCIPDIARSASEKYDIPITLLPEIGVHPLLSEAIKNIVSEAERKEIP